MKHYRTAILIICVIFLTPLLSISQSDNEIEKLFNPPPNSKLDMMPKSADFSPYYTWRFHKNGKLWNTINNNGILGNFFGVYDSEEARTAASYFFPRYSRIRHGFTTSLWVGGVIGRDTLVSTAQDVTYRGWWTRWRPELWPADYPDGDFKELERDLGAAFGSNLSRSQVIFEADFVDTFRYNSFVPYSNYDQRYHQPLDIKVTQTSFSWSYKYAEDFLIVRYTIENIGNNHIDDAFVGLYHTGAIHHIAELPYPRLDDIEGYIDSFPYEFEELGNEPMNISWTCDKDGYPQGSSWNMLSTKNCFGIAPLDVPDGANIMNFNWWVDISSDSWGPRKKGTADDPLRLFYGEYGAPLGDANKYYMMAHPEQDYCGYKAMKNNEFDGWMPPHEYGEQIARGHYVHYLTSFGPFDLAPNEKKSVVVVYTVGEAIHTYGGAYRDFFDPLDPDEFLDYLNFDDLITNVRWAKRIYDNPGVDTDFDGDSGKYFIYFDPVTEESLQVYYEGDGVPDFRGATPPPTPEIRVETEEGKIKIRWNGRITENYFDSFSLIRDFEGYRVYLARSKHVDDIVLLSSYDREDYSRWKWNHRRHRYEMTEIPFTLDSLRLIYEDDFEPLDYDRVNPLIIGTDYYYFTKVDYNYANLDNPNQIHKIYPDAIQDTSDVDDEGRMRFYEYEYIIDDLLPSIPYYVSITAFDFGHPAKSLEPLESSPYENMFEVFAVDQSEDAVFKDNKLNVYVYPNPYIADGRYARDGIENRFTDVHLDRSRTIYFANLPNKCTIKVFSLDGDLVKKVEHDEPPGSGTSTIERFDLISRNTQAVESGLFYWVVESEYGSQIGKLVIIK